MGQDSRSRLARILAIAVAPAILAAAPAFSQWQEGGRKVPDKPWSKSDGSLGVMLVLTDEPEAFYAAWAKENPGVPAFEPVVAKRGSPLVGVVMFTGCAHNASGSCDAAVKYTVLKPDGTAYGQPQAGDLWVGKPSPPPNRPRLSVANIGVVIEPKDAAGLYTVRAEVEDRVAGKKLVLERTFEAPAAETKK